MRCRSCGVSGNYVTSTDQGILCPSCYKFDTNAFTVWSTDYGRRLMKDEMGIPTELANEILNQVAVLIGNRKGHTQDNLWHNRIDLVGFYWRLDTTLEFIRSQLTRYMPSDPGSTQHG